MKQSLVLIFALVCLAACKDDNDPVAGFDGRPIVAVHGFLGSGDTYAPTFKRFEQRGYPVDYLRTYDYNSLSDDALAIDELDAFIDAVLLETGAENVDLMGHSKGGSISYQFLADPVRAAKVNRYVHIGSFAVDSLPGPISAPITTLNVWSTGDAVISELGDIPGAMNLRLEDLDHYQVATDDATSQGIWEFLRDEAYGADPATSLSAEEPHQGKALSFGENKPVSGGSIAIWALDDDAQRTTTDAMSTVSVAEDGTWGPVNLDPNVRHEFVVQGAGASSRTVHYFREAEGGGGHWIYLRTIPPPLSLAGLLLSALPQDDDQSVIAVFSSSQAVIADRDVLVANSDTLSTTALASAAQTSIAYFLYDDGDGISSGTADPAFASFPFLNAVDLFYPTATPATIELIFNGRRLPVRNLRSDSDGIVVAVFQ